MLNDSLLIQFIFNFSDTADLNLFDLFIGKISTAQILLILRKIHDFLVTPETILRTFCQNYALLQLLSTSIIVFRLSMVLMTLGLTLIMRLGFT